MTLASRLLSLISEVGEDVNSLQSQIISDEQAMLPDSIKQCNLPVSSILSNAISSLASGRLSLVRCPVKAGQQINGISFFSAGGSTLPTNQVFALYRPDLTLIGTTVNDGTAGWTGTARKRLALITPYIPSEDGWVYVGIVVTATFVPTLAGLLTALSATSLSPIIHGYSDTGLSTPESFPATAGALTALAYTPAVMLD